PKRMCGRHRVPSARSALGRCSIRCPLGQPAVIGAPLRNLVVEFEERRLQHFLQALARFEMSLSTARYEDGLIRLRIACLRLCTCLLDLKDSEISELDADFWIGLQQEIADGIDDGSHPWLAFVDGLIHQVRYATRNILLRQRDWPFRHDDSREGS